MRKRKVMPEGLHPIAQYRFKYDLTQGELSSLLEFDRKILDAIEKGTHEPTEEEKKRIRIITGIIV